MDPDGRQDDENYYSYDWISKVPDQYKEIAKLITDKRNQQHREDIQYLAMTIYGEARGENSITKTAVAWSIRNRKEIKLLSIKEIVTKTYQYSCWNEDDVNYYPTNNPELHSSSYEGGEEIWNECLSIAKNVLESQKSDDITNGATHYYDKSLDFSPPRWSDPMLEPRVKKITIMNVENIRFFTGVRF